MKPLLLTLLLTLFFATSAYAQTMTGPGLENDEPPSAAVDRQEDMMGEQTSMNREAVHEKKKVNPLKEKGPQGKEAQEEAKHHKLLNMNKKEMERKQKGG